MTDFEAHKEHIQYTHNAYCKLIIRHAAIDAALMLRKKWSREISFEYISEERFYPFPSVDKQPMREEYFFTSCGHTVILDNPVLAAALSRLPEQKQEMVFLHYFLKQTHTDIGKRYGRKRSATGRHIHNALKQLREEMEKLLHE